LKTSTRHGEKKVAEEEILILSSSRGGTTSTEGGFHTGKVGREKRDTTNWGNLYLKKKTDFLYEKLPEGFMGTDERHRRKRRANLQEIKKIS